jgi:hypothetical protein
MSIVHPILHRSPCAEAVVFCCAAYWTALDGPILWTRLLTPVVLLHWSALGTCWGSYLDSFLRSSTTSLLLACSQADMTGHHSLLLACSAWNVKNQEEAANQAG